MKIVGKLTEKFETIKVSEKFQKREIVITDNSSMYEQQIKIEFKQDKCSLVDSYNLGDNIEVSVNILGRKWINPQGEAKYFNTIEGWKIEPDQAPQNSTEYKEPTQAKVEPQKKEPDNLPF